jgi:BRCA1-associated protein
LEWDGALYQGADRVVPLVCAYTGVWDYSSDNYVHRLVQSKARGKLVELPSPAPSSSERGAATQCARALPSVCTDC